MESKKLSDVENWELFTMFPIHIFNIPEITPSHMYMLMLRSELFNILKQGVKK